MARSLSYAAYRALSRRRSRQASGDVPPRPDGELIWAHANSDLRYSALCDLSQRLTASRPGLNMLLTVDRDRFSPPTGPRPGCFRVERLASDHPSAMRLLLDHWSPDLALWAGADLMPNLIRAGSEAGLPMILLDADEAEFQTRWHKWFPDLIRSTLGCFDAIMANSEATARMLSRTGVPADRITIATRLMNNPAPPPCNDDDLSDLTDELAARPVWLAVHAQAAEFDAILAAHRGALRFLHRLLLVITPADADDQDLLEVKLTASGLRHSVWHPGDEIEDNSQVIVADNQQDRGLWYRIAPLCLMGGTLVPGHKSLSPLEPASLGSAILHGPHVGPMREPHERLLAAGALQPVRTVDDLGNAVIDLMAPDRAAGMALAGWEVATEGAEATDTLIDLVLDLLDTREATNARS